MVYSDVYSAVKISYIHGIGAAFGGCFEIYLWMIWGLGTRPYLTLKVELSPSKNIYTCLLQ